jgi:hypothetical protein
MGNFQTKIENNVVTSLHLKNKNKNNDVATILKRYKKYLNDSGFYIISINSNLLKHKLKQSFRKLKLQGISLKELPEDIIHILRFVSNQKIDKIGDEKISRLIMSVLELASTFGFFSILHNDKLKNLSNIDKLTKLKIVIPKMLFNTYNQDFFDFLTLHFISHNSKNIPQNILDIIKHTLPNMLKNVFETGRKNRDANNFRFANILNILFNFSIGLSILSISYNDTKYKGIQIHEIAGELLGDLSKYIKDDECVAANLITSEVTDSNNFIKIEPNICNKKPNINLNKCPECPVCPTNTVSPTAFPTAFPTTGPATSPTTSPNNLATPKISDAPPESKNRTFMIVGIVVILLLIILYFGYRYMKPSESSEGSETPKETDT